MDIFSAESSNVGKLTHSSKAESLKETCGGSETFNGLQSPIPLPLISAGGQSVLQPDQGDSISQLAVIIPAHNNELTIGTLVILSKKYAGTVIVADRGSTDRTVEVAECAGAKVIDARPYGGGRVQSILAACVLALSCHCEAVVLITSGGEYLTREIPRIARPVLDGKADLVIGSRYLSGRKASLPNQIEFDIFHSDSLEKKTNSSSDPNSSFRAISVKGICLLDLLPDSPAFESMMVSLFTRKGLSIQEIPITLRQEHEVIDRDNIPNYRGNKIAVVVPAYNEEILIAQTLSSMPDFIHTIYAIDDCSKDRTWKIIQECARLNKKIVPIHHEVNGGVGKSISSGFKKAIHDEIDIVVVMAGDNQMDPKYLPDLLDPIVEKKYEFTKGNRLKFGYWKGMSHWRLFGNIILTKLNNFASGYWEIKDPQNGYVAISTQALKYMDLDNLYPRYAFENDMMVKANIVNIRMKNIDIPAKYGNERSNIRYPNFIYTTSIFLLESFIFRILKKSTQYDKKSINPVYLMYISGVILLVVGFPLIFLKEWLTFVIGITFFVSACIIEYLQQKKSD